MKSKVFAILFLTLSLISVSQTITEERDINYLIERLDNYHFKAVGPHIDGDGWSYTWMKINEAVFIVEHDIYTDTLELRTHYYFIDENIWKVKEKGLHKNQTYEFWLLFNKYRKVIDTIKLTEINNNFLKDRIEEIFKQFSSLTRNTIESKQNKSKQIKYDTEFDRPLLSEIGFKYDTLKNPININLDGFSVKDTLKLIAYIADCGEWGGHKESITITKEKACFKLSFDYETPKCDIYWLQMMPKDTIYVQNNNHDKLISYGSFEQILLNYIEAFKGLATKSWGYSNSPQEYWIILNENIWHLIDEGGRWKEYVKTRDKIFKGENCP